MALFAHILTRPGLLALYGISLLGLLLVAHRGWVRARRGEPVYGSIAWKNTVRVVSWLAVIAATTGIRFGLGARGRLPRTTWWMVAFGGVALVAVTLATRKLPSRGSYRLAGPVRGIPWGLWTLCGFAFLTLTTVSLRLPVSRGTQYVLWHEQVRFGALAFGVVFLLGVLSALLPLGLDRLERWPFVAFVGARHVRASKSGFLTVISVLSICGVAVSSCSLCSVVSIMGGFGQDLKRKILGNNAHVTIDQPGHQGGFDDWTELLERVRAVPGVEAVTPVAAGEAMASSNATTAGVLVRGINPDTIGHVIDLVKNIEYGALDYLIDETKLQDLPPDELIGRGLEGQGYRRGSDSSAPVGLGVDPAVRAALKNDVPAFPGLIIGRELARTLHLLVGDEVTLVSPLGDLGPMGVLPRSRKFRVAAIFYSGMYEYDATHVYLRMDVAQAFFSMEHRITTVDVRAVDAEATEALLEPLRRATEEPSLRVRDWREMNRNLFSALKLERVATFIILSIAIAVASFCIICTLLLMVTEKGKEIAILKALGASDQAIRAVFMTEGIIIGGIGTTFGVATGVAMCLGLKWFGVRLDPDVYYIDRLPVATNASDYVLVAAAALFICTLATLYPAGAASKLRPVDGLRYE